MIAIRSMVGSAGLSSVAALASLLVACGGGALPPTAAVGKVGSSLSAHSQGVPQGAEICALTEALKRGPGKAGKPVSEPCEKNVASDELWRRSMGVLAAYGAHLEALSADEDPASSGQLQAALTGVRGPNWIEVEDDDEKAARNAVAELVGQMEKANSDSDLEQTVKDAAPRIGKVCDGLIPFLEEQATSAATLRTELAAKEKAPASRRCAMLDSRPICMADNVVDHMVYATEFGRLSSLESRHREARNAVAAFCAAHAKLDKAAAAGTLDDESTARSVIDEIKRAIPERSAAASGADAEEAPPATTSNP